MKTGRFIGTIILTILLTVSLTGFTAAKTKVELTVLRPGTPEKVRAFLEPAIKEFEEANPDIKVNIQYSDWNEYLTRIATWMAAGKAPDVFLANDHTMPYYAEQGALLPLDGLLDERLESEIPPSLWEAGVWRGKTYLVPASVGAITMYWRKDLFAEAGLPSDSPPKSIEEFLDYAQKLTREGYYGYGLPMASWDVGWEQQVSLFYHGFTDEAWFDKQAKPLLYNEKAREAFQFVVDLANKYKCIYPNPFEYGENEMLPIFRDKKVAMICGGPWFYPFLIENFDFSSSEACEIGISITPRNGAKGSIMGADGWVISANTKHPREAAKLLNFLVNEKNQYNHGIVYGLAPTQKCLFDKGEYQKWYWKPQIEAVETAFTRAHTPFTQEFYIEAFNLTQLALIGKMPVDAAFNEIVKIANKLAEKY